MEQNGTGCQAHEAPLLCANNCGFFGTAATMNMCSKCYKDLMMKQENEKIAASSIESILHGSASTSMKKLEVLADVDTQSGLLEPPVLSLPAPSASHLDETEKINEGETEKTKGGPNRCNTCRKRVGLTGFNCRCGNLFCSTHRYTDKHGCPYDYKSAAQDAISKANPVVKASKLNKI